MSLEGTKRTGVSHEATKLTAAVAFVASCKTLVVFVFLPVALGPNFPPSNSVYSH